MTNDRLLAVPNVTRRNPYLVTTLCKAGAEEGASSISQKPAPFRVSDDDAEHRCLRGRDGALPLTKNTPPGVFSI